jgi:proteasome accessory factor B
VSKQIPRQWRILKRLEAHRFGLTAANLAEEEGCPVRTIFRDLNALQDAGFPLENERRGRHVFWKLSTFHQQSQSIPFDYTEVCGLWLGRGLMETLDGTTFYESISQAFAKIRSTLPPGVLEHLEEFESKVSVRRSRTQIFSEATDILQELNEALEEEESVEIVYYSPSSDKETTRQVDPYRLLLQDDVMYLIGYCHLREGIRTFHLARVRKVEPTGQYFEVPEDFSLEEYLDGNFRTMAGEVMDVEILFDKEVSHVPRERKWHPTQEVTEQEDGRVLVTLQAGGLNEIKSWLLSFGPKIEVIKPDLLRAAMHEDLQKALARYSS